jgi:hypothetical protein
MSIGDHASLESAPNRLEPRVSTLVELVGAMLGIMPGSEARSRMPVVPTLPDCSVLVPNLRRDNNALLLQP